MDGRMDRQARDAAQCQDLGFNAQGEEKEGGGDSSSAHSFGVILFKSSKACSQQTQLLPPSHLPHKTACCGARALDPWWARGALCPFQLGPCPAHHQEAWLHLCSPGKASCIILKPSGAGYQKVRPCLLQKGGRALGTIHLPAWPGPQSWPWPLLLPELPSGCPVALPRLFVPTLLPRAHYCHSCPRKGQTLYRPLPAFIHSSIEEVWSPSTMPSSFTDLLGTPWVPRQYQYDGDTRPDFIDCQPQERWDPSPQHPYSLNYHLEAALARDNTRLQDK